jgi:hypothetical protein
MILSPLTPAKAGVQSGLRSACDSLNSKHWVPAFAGTSG